MRCLWRDLWCLQPGNNRWNYMTRNYEFKFLFCTFKYHYNPYYQGHYLKKITIFIKGSYPKNKKIKFIISTIIFIFQNMTRMRTIYSSWDDSIHAHQLRPSLILAISVSQSSIASFTPGVQFPLGSDARTVCPTGGNIDNLFTLQTFDDPRSVTRTPISVAELAIFALAPREDFPLRREGQAVLPAWIHRQLLYEHVLYRFEQRGRGNRLRAPDPQSSSSTIPSGVYLWNDSKNISWSLYNYIIIIYNCANKSLSKHENSCLETGA